MDKAASQLESFLSVIHGSPETGLQLSNSEPASKPLTKTHFAMDFSVNYCGYSVPTVEYTHPDYAT